MPVKLLLYLHIIEAFSSPSSPHSSFQHYKSYQAEKKLSDHFQFGFSVMCNQNMQTLLLPVETVRETELHIELSIPY